MLRYVLAFTALAVMTSAGPAQAGSDTGWLLLKKFVPDSQKDEFRGFKEPKLFVYDESGKPLAADRPGGAWGPGDLVELPAGWYQVEVGDRPNQFNRWKYKVVKGRVTVVRSGLALLPTVPVKEQPPDPRCKQWRAVMTASLWDAEGQLQLIMSNDRPEVDDFGMLQLHEGKYVIGFNQLFSVLEIKADKTLSVPTVQIGPLDINPYRLSMRKGDSADNPTLTLCQTRPTQLLAGRYYGSHMVDTMSPPFRKKVWEIQEIQPPGKPKYKKAPKVRFKGKVYVGEGSRPTHVTPLPAIDPLPSP